MCFNTSDIETNPPRPPRREKYGKNITKYIADQTRYQEEYEKYMARHKSVPRVVRATSSRQTCPRPFVDEEDFGKRYYYHPSREICWY